MSLRILIICPILPRPPIRLVLFGLSLRDERTRRKFSYIPLALFFRRSREYAAELIHPTCYSSQDGANITVAPRFEFTIHLVSNLKLLTDYQQILKQQSWNESNNVSTILNSHIARNFQWLAKSAKSQSDLIKRLFICGFMKKQWNPMNSTFAGFCIPSYQSNPKDTGFEWDLHRENHLFGAASAVHYPTLALKHEFLSSAIKNRKNLPPISGFDQASQFLPKEANFEKGIHSKSRPLEVASTTDYPILAFKPQFLSGAIRKVLRQDITLSSQQNIRKRNMIYPKADFPFISLLTPSIFTSKDAKPTGSIENLDFRLPGRQRVRQRGLGISQEKLISPTSLDYRTEKKIQAVSVATVTESKSLPVSAPKIDIDRLSRDVWNKIEKRIRIERERHGRL